MSCHLYAGGLPTLFSMLNCDVCLKCNGEFVPCMLANLKSCLLYLQQD
jgi:hypothetical protein